MGLPRKVLMGKQNGTTGTRVGQMRKKNGTTEKKKWDRGEEIIGMVGKLIGLLKKEWHFWEKKIGPPRKKWDNCGNKKMGLLEKANKDFNKVSYDSP